MLRANSLRFSRLLAGSIGPRSRCSLRCRFCVRIRSGSAFASRASIKQPAGPGERAGKKSPSARAAPNPSPQSSPSTQSGYYGLQLGLTNGCQAGQFVDTRLKVLRLEDGRRTDEVGAHERGCALQLRITDVGIRQFPFAGVPPFEPLVTRRIAQRRAKQTLCLCIVLVADNRQVQRLSPDFQIREQRARRRQAKDYRNGGQIAHFLLAHFLLMRIPPVVEEQVRSASRQHVLLALWVRLEGAVRRYFCGEETSPLGVSEAFFRKFHRRFGVAQPLSVTCGAVQRLVRALHVHGDAAERCSHVILSLGET